MLYPDWPASDADLVPLPQVDGPKLKPFKFSRARKIDFLEHAGAGTHAQVFKVKMEEEIYALKVFRWTEPDEWIGLPEEYDEIDHEAHAAIGAYSEPFNCECRAFARLQEAKHEDLAVRCFGYVLINEEEEKEIVDRFKVNFDSGNYDFDIWDRAYAGAQRPRYVGKTTEREPPLRAIVKAFGKADPTLKTSLVNKLFRDMVQLHQVGIAYLDVAHRQLVDGKLADFSTALTTPNFVMTPELNPLLSPKDVAVLECETFGLCYWDFREFEDLVSDWNREHEKAKDKLWIQTRRRDYNLRRVPSRDDRPYTFVDPRLYDWKGSSVASEGDEIANKPRGGTRKRRRGAVDNSGSGGGLDVPKKKQRRLDPRPARWYLNGNHKGAAHFDKHALHRTVKEYKYRDGLIFPEHPRVATKAQPPAKPRPEGLAPGA